MKPDELAVEFLPAGHRVFVLPGTTVLEAAGRAGLALRAPCGGGGTCGKCRVRVAGDPAAVTDEAGPALPAALRAAGWRLACHARIVAPATIEIPAEATFETGARVLTQDAGFDAGDAPVLDAAIRKAYLELPPPSRADAAPDLARLRRALGADIAIAPERLAACATALRRQDWRGTAVLADDRLLALESGDTRGVLLGAAFDIGTTTVVGTLYDLNTGRELAVAARLNAQIPLGDDVLSRIRRVREDAAQLAILRAAITGTLNEILDETLARAGAPAEALYELAVAGNTTMQQILCGFDPAPLGEVPFVPAFDRAQVLSATRLGLRANPVAEVYVFPQIGGFVGGDTVAGMLATRLDRAAGPTLLVDIGTNGELVLAAGGRLLAASAAAGPAFEGARIAQGMRATSGAIEKVLCAEDGLRINVIGNARPTGLCGTALIDATALLLDHGLLETTGRLLDADEAPATAHADLRRRLIEADGAPAFVLAWPDEAAGGAPVLLRQRDLRELQLASGAIRAAIAILLRRAGLTPGDLDAVLLAGAFGNFIRRRPAVRMGLLPAIPHTRIRYVGNAASLGAKRALLSRAEREYAERLRAAATHVDLSGDPAFQEEFGNAMLFPDADNG